MSSTVSTTELLTIPPRAVAKLKMEEKPARLVRTSSIEKIRRFNSFICSQHYYILPALLSWLKSSQTVLQSSTERTIFLFRSVIFNTFFYKLYLMGFKSSGLDGVRDKIQIDIKQTLANIISNFFRIFTNCFESTFLLSLAIYTACLFVFVQLITVFYLIYFTFLPYGFIFLIGCTVSMVNLCYKTTMFHCLRERRKESVRRK